MVVSIVDMSMFSLANVIPGGPAESLKACPHLGLKLIPAPELEDTEIADAELALPSDGHSQVVHKMEGRLAKKINELKMKLDRLF